MCVTGKFGKLFLGLLSSSLTEYVKEGIEISFSWKACSMLEQRDKKALQTFFHTAFKARRAFQEGIDCLRLKHGREVPGHIFATWFYLQ